MPMRLCGSRRAATGSPGGDYNRGANGARLARLAATPIGTSSSARSGSSSQAAKRGFFHSNQSDNDTSCSQGRLGDTGHHLIKLLIGRSELIIGFLLFVSFAYPVTEAAAIRGHSSRHLGWLVLGAARLIQIGQIGARRPLGAPHRVVGLLRALTLRSQRQARDEQSKTEQERQEPKGACGKVQEAVATCQTVAAHLEPPEGLSSCRQVH